MNRASDLLNLFKFKFMDQLSGMLLFDDEEGVIQWNLFLFYEIDSIRNCFFH